MPLWQQGWDNFIAEVRDFNSGSQDCTATIQATKNDTDRTVTYTGNSKSNHGHAEIDGLYLFLGDIGWSADAFWNYTLTVECVSKPCCKYCSAVLGLLGVIALDGTYKVNKKMGISYALPPDIRHFIMRLYTVTEQTVLDELTA